MKKTIFISSTFEDLHPHRKAIWELLENYEVHVNGMERFGARKDAPIDTCLNAVERSDIYLGLIAHRRGSVHSIQDKSFTQLEYEKAVELGKEILIYLIDEKEALIKYKDIEFGESYEKLTNFKQLLKEKHTVDFFYSPEDLTQKLKHRLDDLLKRREKEEFFEDYSYSKDILEKFHLFPKKYSDREIKLRIKFKDNGFPASKGICEAFGLSFGETLGVLVEIVEPAIKDNKLKHLFLTEDVADFYFSNRGLDSVEILGRLVFLDQRVANLSATFFDQKHTQRKLNPYYDPSIPSYEMAYSVRSMFDNEKFISETKVVEGESTAIIMFMKALNS
jgi:hypothetical protein